MTVENSVMPRAWKELSGSGNVTNAILFECDTTLYNTGIVQLVGPFVASSQLEGSNDRITWYPLPTIQANVAVANPSVAVLTAVGMYAFNVPCRYVRMRITAYTSGTVVAVGGITTGATPFTTENVNTLLAAGTAMVGSFVHSASATVGTATLSFNFRSAAGTNVALILAGARKLHGYAFYNTSATIAFVKLYNKATAPVVATDVPLLIIPVPPNGERVYRNCQGKSGFALGLGISCTGLISNTDATATTVDQIVGHMDYI